MILHIPHASAQIPADVREGLFISNAELQSELLAMTDWFTDDLFDYNGHLASKVIYPVSRLVADPERFPDDTKEIMAKCGMGAVYTRTSGGDVLRSKLTPSERQCLLDAYYIPHHIALTAAVQAELDRLDLALVVDCHSFPSQPLPYELNQNLDRPDICIGTDEYHSPKSLVETVASCFEDYGYSVGIDRPFSGSIVPSDYYQKNSRVTSIMIEINRRLYMNEQMGVRIDGFETVKKQLSAVLKRIDLS